MIDPAGLTLRNVTFAIGGKKLIDDVSLKAGRGEIIGLLGPNGAGKSSLLRTIYGSNRPAGGVVLIDGVDAWKQSRGWTARNVAAVLQDMPSDFPLTAHDVIAMGRAPHKGLLARDTWQDRALIDAAIALLALTTLKDRMFRSLSGGERQRVLLARALVQQPRLLILDEPTNHLDIHHQLELMRFVREIGVTVIAALHDLNLAAAFCDRLCLLREGRLVADGPPETVLTRERLADVYQIDAVVSRHPEPGHLWVLPY